MHLVSPQTGGWHRHNRLSGLTSSACRVIVTFVSSTKWGCHGWPWCSWVVGGWFCVVGGTVGVGGNGWGGQFPVDGAEPNAGQGGGSGGACGVSKFGGVGLIR